MIQTCEEFWEDAKQICTCDDNTASEVVYLMDAYTGLSIARKAFEIETNEIRKTSYIYGATDLMARLSVKVATLPRKEFDSIMKFLTESITEIQDKKE